MQAKRAEFGLDSDARVAAAPIAAPIAAVEPRDERPAPAAASLGTLHGADRPAKPAPAPPPPTPANEALAYGCLVVGKDVHVAGSLTIPGSVRVEGRIDGKIDAGEVVVLAGGTIIGEIYCAQATLHGTVRGEIHCTERLTITANAIVEGEVHYYRDIAVASGAHSLNCTLTFREDPAPLHNMAPTLDKLAPIFDKSPPVDGTGERDLARELLPSQSSLMSRLFGSGKTH